MAALDDFLLQTFTEGPSVDARRLRADLLQDLMARAPRGPHAPHTEVEAARDLAAMPAIARHAFVRDFIGARKLPAVSALWSLADAFWEVGRYRLAAGLFAHAALTEQAAPVVRAALYARAGGALNDGVGRFVEGWLANAHTLLTETPDDGRSRLAVRLVRSLVYYNLARLEISRDAFDSANEYRRRAGDVLEPDDLAALGTGDHPPGRVPELMMLQARIERGRVEVTGRGDPGHALALLADVEAGAAARGELTPGLLYRLAYQRSAVALAVADLETATTEAVRARGALERDAGTAALLTDPFEPPAFLVHTRRCGYVAHLFGEVAFARREYVSAIEHFQRSIMIWRDPHYTRGITRALRGQALCRIELGSDWSDASRVLGEAIAIAQASRNVGAEARALAAKVLLHARLGHPARVLEYRTRIADVTSAHTDISAILKKIENGHAAPSARVIDRRLQDLASAAGLVGYSAGLDATVADTAEAVRTSRPIVLVSETGCEIGAFARLIDLLREGTGAFVACSPAAPRKRRGRPSRASMVPPPFPGKTVLVEDASLDRTKWDGDLLRRVRQAARSDRTSRIVLSSIDSGIDEFALRKRAAKLLDVPSVSVVRIPALRTRAADVVLLGTRFLEDAFSAYPALAGKVTGLSTEAWRYLSAYHWPGNVDQLRAVMHSLALQVSLASQPGLFLASGEIGVEFVAPSTAHLWMDPGHEVLSPAVPITPDGLRQLGQRRTFRSTADLARHLAGTYQYQGKIDSLVRTLYRRKPFTDVLREIVR